MTAINEEYTDPFAPFVGAGCMGSDTRFISDEFALIVGPTLLTEPVDSQNVFDLALYSVDDILITLLAFPGVRQISDPNTPLRGWAAAWENGNRLILFENVQELDDEDNFGSLDLRCDCHVGDVLELWESLRAQRPGLWLIGSDSWLHTPASFAGRITFNDCWRSSDVIALARGIRLEYAFDRLPILADALQDVGCDSSDVLNHCRASGPHEHRCWVVDLILDKQ